MATITTSPERMPTSMRDRSSSVLVRFTPSSDLTSEQYDEVIRRMTESGDWPADGLDYHVAFRSNGGLRVSEIWDSREQLEATFERLMPILKDVGIEFSDKPEVLEIHNIIKR
jgi:hypothetical protein